MPATALQRCPGARARLPFPSRLLQAAVSCAGGMRVPSMLHVPIMPWAHRHGSCTSQPAKLCWKCHVYQCHVGPMSHACAGPMVFVHAGCGLHRLCAPPVHCFMCVPRRGHTLHARIWVKTACCACPLCAPHTGCTFVLARVLQTSLRVLCELQASVRSLRGLRVTGARDTLQRCAGGVARVCTGHALADGLDLPNASRTNKTFRSGLARGARRQASAELLRAWMVWAGGVLCRGLSAAPSPSFLPSWVPPGWEPVSLLRPLLQTSSSGGKVRKVDA